MGAGRGGKGGRCLSLSGKGGGGVRWGGVGAYSRLGAY